MKIWFSLCLFVCQAAADLASTPQEIDAALPVLIAAATVGQSNSLVAISRNQWERINTARLMTPEKPVKPYGLAKTNVAINAYYFRDGLVMTLGEMLPDFRKARGRDPALQEVYAAWLLGVPAFKRLHFDSTKIKDPNVKIGMQRVDYEQRIANLVKTRNTPPPPALPTNGSPRSPP